MLSFPLFDIFRPEALSLSARCPLSPDFGFEYLFSYTITQGDASYDSDPAWAIGDDISDLLPNNEAVTVTVGFTVAGPDLVFEVCDTQFSLPLCKSIL